MRHHQGVFSVANVAPPKRPTAQLVGKNSHAPAQVLKFKLKHKNVHKTDINTLEEMFFRATDHFEGVALATENIP
jgi:hypothetical protein